MKRSEIFCKINNYALNNNVDEAIELLCELLENKNDSNKDIINLIIEMFQLYGYIGNEDIEFRKYFKDDLNSIRLQTYEGKYIKYLNYGQLSLLDKIKVEKKVLISAPTSFGKTSILLEYIYQNSMDFGKIIFVVPTHSLIEELYIKLLNMNKNIFNKYKITVNIGKLDGRVIRVLTPERFLSYYEHKKIDDIDLIIMDETYKIDSRNINNDEINDDHIINNDNLEDVSDHRELKFRKVLEILGSFRKKVIMLSPYTYEKDESMSKYLRKYSITDENKKIRYVFHNYVDVTNLTDFRSVFNCEISSTEYKNNIVSKTFNILKQIKNDSNIIYISYPSLGIKILNEMKNNDINLLNQNNDERYIKFLDHLISNYSVDEIEEWYVISALKYGVGIYVSSMPRYVKRELIRLFDSNVIKTLIVTTAFVEGVNSSAKNIIVTSGTTGGNKTLNELSLLNIVGRAGRFGRNYVGNVYFIKNETYRKVISSKDRGVKLVNPNYEKISDDRRRSDYELEMIDDEFLNEGELERKNGIIDILAKHNYDYNELSLIAISVPNVWKARLYEHFKTINDINSINLLINNIVKDDSEKFIESLTSIFNILKDIINIKNETNTFSNVPAFTRDGKFLWAELYKIHRNDNIKKILLSKKRYIEEQKVRMANNYRDYKSTWIGPYYNNLGNFDDSKLYEKTFKFISDIIEYKIPYYINFFISIFKYYIEKEGILLEESEDNLSMEEIFEKIENNFVDKDLIEFYDYGFPKVLIDKISKLDISIYDVDIDDLSNFDDFEKIILKEYIEIMK